MGTSPLKLTAIYHEFLHVSQLTKQTDGLGSGAPAAISHNNDFHLFPAPCTLHPALCHRFGDAVILLEHIHSLCPSAGEGNDYFDLLVDLKTKVWEYGNEPPKHGHGFSPFLPPPTQAVFSQLFSVKCWSEREKKAVIDRYFDPQLCSSLPEGVRSKVPVPYQDFVSFNRDQYILGSVWKN